MREQQTEQHSAGADSEQRSRSADSKQQSGSADPYKLPVAKALVQLTTEYFGRGLRELFPSATLDLDPIIKVLVETNISTCVDGRGTYRDGSGRIYVMWNEQQLFTHVGRTTDADARGRVAGYNVKCGIKYEYWSSEEITYVGLVERLVHACWKALGCEKPERCGCGTLHREFAPLSCEEQKAIARLCIDFILWPRVEAALQTLYKELYCNLESH